MGFTFSQSNSATSVSSPASLTCTFGSQPAVGDLIIVAVSSFVTAGGPAPAVTDNFGNTYNQIAITANFGSDAYLSLWYAIVATTGASFTVTASYGAGAAYQSLGILDFTPSATPSTDGSSGATGASGTALASGSFTTTGTDLIICAGEGRLNAQTWTAGSGYTAQIKVPGAISAGTSLCVEYQIGVAAGPQDPSMSCSVSNAWGCIGAAFQVASSGGGGDIITQDQIGWMIAQMNLTPKRRRPRRGVFSR